MEGPTPVSSLIHAATLVTMGLLVLLRLIGMLSLCTLTVMLCYSIVGVSIMNLGLGVDVKRCIAYSTVVQMFFSMVLVLLLVYSVV